MKKPRTKAQVYGFKLKPMQAKAKRVAERARQQLCQVAYDWADIDGTVPGAVDELNAAIDRFEKLIYEAVELLNEPYEE